MIDSEIINKLKNSKNLLAFSAGVDSTALFFILLQNSIDFDISIVNYGLRKEAKEEIEYAKSLAKKYNKQIYIENAPKFKNNFELNAREFRYNFFSKIIKEHSYKNLLTAHQLNDKLEWHLMRLSKGAGVTTLAGMDFIELRDSYNIIRPLLNSTKDELIEFLEKNNIKYFIDKSNFNSIYERNTFRPIVNKLLKTGKDGFIKSFKILNIDKDIIAKQYRVIKSEKELRVIKIDTIEVAPQAVSKYLKELGYLISYEEQTLLLKQNSIVAGRVWAIEIVDNTIFIAPYLQLTIPKKDRENFRVKKIPPKIRGYLYKEDISINL